VFVKCCSSKHLSSLYQNWGRIFKFWKRRFKIWGRISNTIRRLLQLSLLLVLLIRQCIFQKLNYLHMFCRYPNQDSLKAHTVRNDLNMTREKLHPTYQNPDPVWPLIFFNETDQWANLNTCSSALRYILFILAYVKNMLSNLLRL